MTARVVKKFADIESQLKIQKDRQLEITDIDRFRECLLSYNYFELINGFETLLLIDKNDKSKGYVVGTKDIDFFSLYDFDARLNVEVMKSLMAFERKLKSRIAYHFCELYCKVPEATMNYLDKNFYRCPKVTSYSGKYFSDQFNHNSFVFFAKYDDRGNKSSSGTKSYIETKHRIEYIKTYSQPPLWVIIKQLMFNDLYVLTGLLDKPVISAVLKSFGLRISDRDYLLNSLDLFKQLRNHCAHFELVNRFRSHSNLRLNVICNKVKIVPKRNSQGVKTRVDLYDTIQVLSQFTDTKNIYSHVTSFFDQNSMTNKDFLNDRLIERMGGCCVENWRKD